MADYTTTRTEAPPGSTGTLTQLYVGLVWLGTTMWTAHATITGSADGVSGALGSAAAALPGVIAAVLVTGASIGQAAGSRFSAPTGRLLAGLALGGLFGVLAAAGIRFGYGTESSITVFAVTVCAASLFGGALAILPTSVLEAALWATTWVFFAGVIFGVLQPQLITFLGGGETADAAAQAAANTRFTYGQSLLTGLIGGVYAFRSLRGERRALPWYVLAGALPGLLLLFAEGLTRAGGSSVVAGFITGASVGEPALIELTDGARLRHALIVLAVGGIVALVAALRTLGRTDSDESSESSEDSEDSEESADVD